MKKHTFGHALTAGCAALCLVTGAHAHGEETGGLYHELFESCAASAGSQIVDGTLPPGVSSWVTPNKYPNHGSAGAASCADLVWIKALGQGGGPFTVTPEWTQPNVDCTHSTLSYVLYARSANGSYQMVGGAGIYGDETCKFAIDIPGLDWGSLSATGQSATAEYRIAYHTWSHNDVAIGHSGKNCSHPYHCNWPVRLKVSGNRGYPKTDLSVYRPSDQNWYIMDTTSWSAKTVKWGERADVPLSGDFDNDGRSDLTVWRPSTGAWWTNFSSSGNYTAPVWGIQGDVPVVGDYDGDGTSDRVVFKPSTHTWWIFQSKSNTYRTVDWGVSTDVPVVGSFDGDSSDDVTVWRSSNARWYIISSTDGVGRYRPWGASGDQPVPGDYDKDGIDDLAVWRPSNGRWYVVNSSNGQNWYRTWGVSGDKVVPGDYDQDGRMDSAVWRPSNGRWYVVNSSTSGTWNSQWGLSGDIPLAMVR